MSSEKPLSANEMRKRAGLLNPKMVLVVSLVVPSVLGAAIGSFAVTGHPFCAIGSALLFVIWLVILTVVRRQQLARTRVHLEIVEFVMALRDMELDRFAVDSPEFKARVHQFQETVENHGGLWLDFWNEEIKNNSSLPAALS